MKSYERGFQYLDIFRAMNQNRFLFFWDTGTGKSMALSALLTHLRYYKKCNKAIILTSSIGVLNLNGELKKFIKDYDESKTLVIDSISSVKDRLVFKPEVDLLICGFDTFKRINDAYAESKKLGKKYKKSPLPLDEWFGDYEGLLFLDECHLMGNHGSRRLEALMMNLKFFERRYCFSATPLDKEVKMYGLLKVLDEKLINGLSYTEWLSTYCEMGTKFSKFAPNLATWDRIKWNSLQRELYQDYASRRSKKLLNLPEAIDMPVIYLDMSPEQRKLYELFSNNVALLIQQRAAENGFGLVDNLVNTFQYLQLCVDNPDVLKDPEKQEKFTDELKDALNKFNFKKHCSKLHALENIIDYECNELENKIIIFYMHPKTLEQLKEKYPDAYVISAEVPKEERIPIVEKFKKSDSKIIIMSITIANSSFTLTECKAAVYFERTWSYIDYEQSRGRIYRIGQEDEVRYYTLCYNNSIDNLQLKALETKGNLVQGLCRRDSLTSEEWRLIFGGAGCSNEKQAKFLDNLIQL